MDDQIFRTSQWNESSINQVGKMVVHKRDTRPYLATAQTVLPILTDQDHHPYTRWFRGVYYFPEPVIMEREAGWRPVQNECYRVIRPPADVSTPPFCYEAACSTIYPCYPELASRFGEQYKLDKFTNQRCIVADR
jgi:hypothetical protein